MDMYIRSDVIEHEQAIAAGIAAEMRDDAASSHSHSTIASDLLSPASAAAAIDAFEVSQRGRGGRGWGGRGFGGRGFGGRGWGRGFGGWSANET